MNLLRQTALILGLASLSLGSWTLFRDWKNKISILFSFVCFLVSVWALGFVAHATLLGRLSYDIHLFCNVLIVPFTLDLLARIFLKERDRMSQGIFYFASVGTAVLCFMILFSLGEFSGFREWVLFWPSLIFVEYFHILFLEAQKNERSRMDPLSPSKKILLFLGLGLTLTFCTFDHIPAYGYVLPAVGNLLFTLYLFSASQVIIPEKLLGLEALASRFFAVLTLSLMITGFFALTFSYISATFPLFLLNSFLISFAVLALWGPLVTFFRFLARKIFISSRVARDLKVEQFRVALSAMTDREVLLDSARNFLIEFFDLLDVSFEVHSIEQGGSVPIPAVVTHHFDVHVQEGQVPVLYQEFLMREREQVLNSERKRELDLLMQFLVAHDCDFIFPMQVEGRVSGWIKIKENRGRGIGGALGLGFLFTFLDELSGHLKRVLQIEAARERDRLILLGEMAAGLAHEIRNPLGAIRGAANLIESDSGPWGKVIQEEVDRLNRLVSQFLDFSRNQNETREAIDLEALVPRILEQLAKGVESRIELRFKGRSGDVGGQNPVTVFVVPDSIQQILLNLVQNSVKALELKTDPWIEVRVIDGGFKVIDNGIGMDSETLGKVFQPFFTSFKAGSGLGLSICEKLVRFDRGRVSFHSVAGEGTEVTVEYPHA